MAYKKKTPVVVEEAATFTKETWDNVEPSKEYLVVEAFTAHVNNKPLKGVVGKRINLTPTQYSVVKRFVLPLD